MAATAVSIETRKVGAALPRPSWSAAI